MMQTVRRKSVVESLSSKPATAKVLGPFWGLVVVG